MTNSSTMNEYGVTSSVGTLRLRSSSVSNSPLFTFPWLGALSCMYLMFRYFITLREGDECVCVCVLNENRTDPPQLFIDWLILALCTRGVELPYI